MLDHFCISDAMVMAFVYCNIFTCALEIIMLLLRQILPSFVLWNVPFTCCISNGYEAVKLYLNRCRGLVF